eukprot:g284.t1
MLKCLLPHLENFVSIASPHLGYSRDVGAKLHVSTGLALMKRWDRQTKTIEELLMQDDSVHQSEKKKKQSHSFASSSSSSLPLRKTYLYELAHSSKDILLHFNKLIFVASPQDQYVPWQSARVELKKSRSTMSMSKNKGQSKSNEGGKPKSRSRGVEFSDEGLVGFNNGEVGFHTTMLATVNEMANLIAGHHRNVERIAVHFAVNRHLTSLLDWSIGRAGHIQFLEDATVARVLAAILVSSTTK